MNRPIFGDKKYLCSPMQAHKNYQWELLKRNHHPANGLSVNKDSSCGSCDSFYMSDISLYMCKKSQKLFGPREVRSEWWSCELYEKKKKDTPPRSAK